MNKFQRLKKIREKNYDRSINKSQAIRMMETAYLAASTSLIWIALYYLPIGGAFFRLALPLPLALLYLRRGDKAGLEGVFVSILLLVCLMGPVRGPLMLFPYGMLSIWLGWSWRRAMSWWISWLFGVIVGTGGFFIRVFVLSLLVGENLWVVITRAGSSLLERFIGLLQLQVVPDITQVQIMAFLLVLLQEIIYVLTLHALALWIFPRLSAKIPDPPSSLSGIVALDPL